MGNDPCNRDFRRTAGYTLIELIVVMSILALMAAGVTPIFAGSLSWVRSDRVARDLVASFRYAGELAIMHETEYRLYIDTTEKAFWLEKRVDFDDHGDPVFEPADGAEGRKETLPEGMELPRPRARVDRSSNRYFISFYPGGACDVATVWVETNDGGTVRIKTTGSLGSIEVEED